MPEQDPPERGLLVAAAEDEIATITLVVRYFKPAPGQLTSRVWVEASETSIPLDGHDANSIIVWAVDGERVGAELHRCLIDAAELMLEPWTDAAEKLQRDYAEARRGEPEAPPRERGAAPSDAGLIVARIRADDSAENWNLRAFLLRCAADCSTPIDLTSKEQCLAYDTAVRFGLWAPTTSGPFGLTQLGHDVAARLRPRPWRALASGSEWAVRLSPGRLPKAMCLVKEDADAIAAMFTGKDLERAITYGLDWVGP
jgi:hypothetical protein